jgi:hypothetical protein
VPPLPPPTSVSRNRRPGQGSRASQNQCSSCLSHVMDLMERCTVISNRAELETFASQILVNLIHAFSKRHELQKSRADDGDFCNMFCTTSPRLSSIEAVVVQPIDDYMQKFPMTGTPFHSAARAGTGDYGCGTVLDLSCGRARLPQRVSCKIPIRIRIIGRLHRSPQVDPQHTADREERC